MPRSFSANSSFAIPVIVGRELLGKLLIRREGRNLLAGRIVEDEAYLGARGPSGARLLRTHSA